MSRAPIQRLILLSSPACRHRHARLSLIQYEYAVISADSYCLQSTCFLFNFAQIKELHPFPKVTWLPLLSSRPPLQLHTFHIHIQVSLNPRLFSIMTVKLHTQEMLFRMSALQSILANQALLTRVVFVILSKIILQLPRKITSTESFTNQQRHNVISRPNHIQHDHVASLPTKAGPAPGRQSDSVEHPPRLPTSSSSSPPLTARSSACCAGRGQAAPVSASATAASMARCSSPRPTTAAYTTTVNISGDDGVVNVDDLFQVAGRQARAWQTRQGKLSGRTQNDGHYGISQGNLVINISGSRCVVGGGSTVNSALAVRKRQRDTSEAAGVARATKQESFLGQRAARRRKLE